MAGTRECRDAHSGRRVCDAAGGEEDCGVKKFILFMLLFLLAFPNPVRAENAISLKEAAAKGYFPPPVEPVDNMDLKSVPVAKSSPVSALELGTLEVELEKTTLQDV